MDQPVRWCHNPGELRPQITLLSHLTTAFTDAISSWMFIYLERSNHDMVWTNLTSTKPLRWTQGSKRYSCPYRQSHIALSTEISPMVTVSCEKVGRSRGLSDQQLTSRDCSDWGAALWGFHWSSCFLSAVSTASSDILENGSSPW